MVALPPKCFNKHTGICLTHVQIRHGSIWCIHLRTCDNPSSPKHIWFLIIHLEYYLDSVQTNVCYISHSTNEAPWDTCDIAHDFSSLGWSGFIHKKVFMIIDFTQGGLGIYNSTSLSGPCFCFWNQQLRSCSIFTRAAMLLEANWTIVMYIYQRALDSPFCQAYQCVYSTSYSALSQNGAPAGQVIWKQVTFGDDVQFTWWHMMIADFGFHN